MMRVVQISDTHLSPGKRHFGDNWAPVARWIAAEQPDLVIHTGDVTVDGRPRGGHRYSACAARAAFRGWPSRQSHRRCTRPHQPVNDERIALWRRHFGDDCWMRDVEDWRLLGLNALLLGSGDADESRQMAWLEDDGRRARPRIGLVLHRPLFLNAPDEPDTGYWSVKPAQRRVLMELVHHHGVALVASGHLHFAA